MEISDVFNHIGLVAINDTSTYLCEKIVVKNITLEIAATTKVCIVFPEQKEYCSIPMLIACKDDLPAGGSI